MLYIGIDQHRKQLTVSVRDESGSVVVRRQVSTHWEKVRAFFSELRERAEVQGGYLAIVEICGFNHWLLTSCNPRRNPSTRPTAATPAS